MLDPNYWSLFDVIGNVAEVVDEVEPYYPLILRDGSEFRYDECPEYEHKCLYYKVKGDR